MQVEFLSEQFYFSNERDGRDMSDLIWIGNSLYPRGLVYGVAIAAVMIVVVVLAVLAGLADLSK